MRKTLLFLVLCAFPMLTYAQTAQALIGNLITFSNNVLIPFLIGIAFLFIVINGVRYFVIEAANEDSRTKARSLAIYGVVALVIIVTFWGIVNMLAASIGLQKGTMPTPDYITETKK